MSTQQEALRLADWIENDMTCGGDAEIAAELRRQHALIAELLGLLREAADYTRHPDYDWPVEFSRLVDAAIAKAGLDNPA